MGVAADDYALLEALVAVVPLAADARSAPRTLALVGPGADPDGGPARTHYALWEASQEVVRCRTPQRLVRAAVAWLDRWVGSRPDGLVGLRWLAAIDARDRAVLLPAHLRGSLHPLGARLRRIGLRPVDSPLIDLDPVSGELVVGPSAVAGVLPDAEEAVPSGRYRVGHLVVPVEAEAPLRAVDALCALARAGLPASPAATLRALVPVVAQARLHRLGSGTADRLVADLGKSLGGGSSPG